MLTFGSFQWGGVTFLLTWLELIEGPELAALAHGCCWLSEKKKCQLCWCLMVEVEKAQSGAFDELTCLEMVGLMAPNDLAADVH